MIRLKSGSKVALVALSNALSLQMKEKIGELSRVLEEMGLIDLDPEEYGYFVVGYNIEDIKVVVINTTGYKGNYTLEELNLLVEEQE